MSSYYYILPYDPKAWEDPDDHSERPTSDLVIDPDEFKKALFGHWGPDKIEEETTWWLMWLLSNKSDPEGNSMRVSLHDDHQVIALSTGPKHILLEFVLWYRGFVPAKYPLYLNHSSSFERLLLTGSTTEEDIIAFTGIVS